MPDFIEPGSPEWLKIITPSKVAAIVGASRYESPYSLWCRMKGLADPEPPKDEFACGHAWEPALRELWKLEPEAQGWRISPRGVQMVTDKFGFPAAVTLDRRASRGSHRRVVEFKITGSIEDWGGNWKEDPNPPMDYRIQVLMQMAFTGWTEHDGHLFVGGPRIRQRHLYPIAYRPDLVNQMIAICQDFWESLAHNDPPPLDNHIATYQLVREMHPDIEPCIHELDDDGKPTICTGPEVDPVLIERLRCAKQETKDAQDTERGLKTRVLDAMGGAQHARIGNVIVADRRPHAKGSVALNVNNRPFAGNGHKPEGTQDD